MSAVLLAPALDSANTTATFTVGVLAPSNPNAGPKEGSGTSIQVTTMQVNGAWVAWIGDGTKPQQGAFPLPGNATSVEVRLQPRAACRVPRVACPHPVRRGCCVRIVWHRDGRAPPRLQAFVWAVGGSRQRDTAAGSDCVTLPPCPPASRDPRGGRRERAATPSRLARAITNVVAGAWFVLRRSQATSTSRCRSGTSGGSRSAAR